MNIEKEIEEAQALVESLKAKQAEQAEQKKKRTGKIMCGSELEEGQLFYVLHRHHVSFMLYSAQHVDDQEIVSGLAYFDEESAELALEKAKIIHRMAIAARECSEEIDWLDENQKKYYLFWDSNSGKVRIGWTASTKSASLPHFTDKHRLEAFRDSQPEHELWVLLIWEGDL